MQKITQSLALDLVEVQHNVVNARQNDMLTRDLYITVTDKGNVYDNLPETAFAYLRGRRTDGKPVFYNVEIADRQNVLLHAELHDYLLCLPGRCKLDIGIYNRVQNENGIRNGTATPNQADEIASTDSFILYIPEEVFDETDVVESDEGSTLAKLINSARDEINEMNSLEERVTNNETKRESNENTRKEQEEKRQEDTESAINRTNTAATSANTAAQTTNNAAQTANAAATAANNAAGNANSAAENANNKAADLQQKLDSHHFALTEDLQSHNSSSTAHEDIRSLISGLTTRLNALADSDDTTLDQLSEIVAYIKNNKSLIDGVTTSKVSVSDIVDNLTSTATNKPLSAKQGKAVKDLIDALTTTVGNKVDKVSGKGLSANDFTTDEKNKLSGIASGAEVNVQSDWNVTDTTSDAYIKNKPTIPSAVAKVGDTMTGDLTIIKPTNDVLVKAKRSDTGTQIRFGVGVDGIAHGIWSDIHNKWIAYADNDGIYVNGSAETIRETLPISKGGTGKTTGASAITALVDSLSAGSTAPIDTDTYLATGVGSSSGNYCRRPMSYLWEYIKSKWDAAYNKKTHIGRGAFEGNINDIRKAGVFWCKPATTGKPGEYDYGLLISETSDGESACMQTFYAYNGNGTTSTVYERTNTNNVWTPWVKRNAGTADKLTTARSIFGKNFDGTGNIGGQVLCYGHVCDPVQRFAYGGIQVRECDAIGVADGSRKYSPAIGFHWSNRCAGSLIMNGNGIFEFLKQNDTKAYVHGTFVSHNYLYMNDSNGCQQQIIRAYPDGTSTPATNYGSNYVIQGGGNMFIGAGESPQTLYDSLVSTPNQFGLIFDKAGEDLFLGADSSILLTPGMQAANPVSLKCFKDVISYGNTSADGVTIMSVSDSSVIRPIKIIGDPIILTGDTNNSVQVHMLTSYTDSLYISQKADNLYLGMQNYKIYSGSSQITTFPFYITSGGYFKTPLSIGQPAGISFSPSGTLDCYQLNTFGIKTYGNILPDCNNSRAIGSSTYKFSQIWCTNGLNSTSDRNVKKDIHDLSADDRYMKFFMLLQPKSYLFKDGESGRTHVGFVAQDVEEAMKEVGLSSLEFAGFCKDVKTKEEEIDPERPWIKKDPKPVLDEDGNPIHIYSLRYEEFIAINTMMIQNLYKKYDDLEKRIALVEGKVFS